MKNIMKLILNNKVVGMIVFNENEENLNDIKYEWVDKSVTG